MALLGSGPSTNLELPPSPAPGVELSAPASSAVVPSALPIPQASPSRLSSNKLPKGRPLSGDRAVYDIHERLRGEVQPQLEVTPITKYGSEPVLVVGRQIAVNRTYICYGLKLGAIGVLNINAALRSLLRGHTQRVTDMVFFAEDVHLLASASIGGRIFVWKINEGPDEEDKPQITGKIVIAIQILIDGESFHPRVCWHSHEQEILVVGIGKWVLKLDTTKVGKGEVFSAEEPMKCAIDKLIDGVQIVGKHDGEVTDLSICQWMTTRLVSASVDGTVKIWENRRALPLVTLRPHDGQPVNSATFLTAPHRPDHIVLITGGHLNREVKVWASASEEGWLLSSDAESWQCLQTLELKSSAVSQPEDAFFNQVVVLPHAGLILLANAKKNAIYAVHMEYGPYPSATHMDYLAEFTVTMPILSLTGTSESTANEEHVVQIYCVQTQAIQQYALGLSQCLPTPFDPESEACMNRFFNWPRWPEENFGPLDPSHEHTGVTGLPAASKPPVLSFSGGPVLPSLEMTTPSSGSKQPPSTNVDESSSPFSLSPRLSGRLSGLRTPSDRFESQIVGDRDAEEPIPERRIDATDTNLSEVPPLEDIKDDKKAGKSDISVVQLQTPTTFKRLTHLITHLTRLITPSEILSSAASLSEKTETQDAVNKDVKSVETEVKVEDVSVTYENSMPLSNAGEEEAQGPRMDSIGQVLESAQVTETMPLPRSGKGKKKKSKTIVSEAVSVQCEKSESPPNKKERALYSQVQGVSNEKTRDCCALPTEILTAVETHQVEDVSVTYENSMPLSNAGEEEAQEPRMDSIGQVFESAQVTETMPLPRSGKGKKQKSKTKVVSEAVSVQCEEFESPPKKKERALYSQVQGVSNEKTRDCCALPTEILTAVETHQVEDVSVTYENSMPLSNAGEEEAQEPRMDSIGQVLESAQVTETMPLPRSGKGKKQKSKATQVSDLSFSSHRSFNSIDSSTEPGHVSSAPTTETALSQLSALQESLNQIMIVQKEMQKQTSAVVAASVNKEGKRIEIALGRTLKKELSAVGPAVARAITQIVEKTISSAISESFQRGVGDKAVGQLEKSVNSKLEATVARQIQGQFQTTGKQALQDALRSSLESSVVPALEMSCKAMFEQVDSAFQKGMAEHTTAAKQQFELAHSPLAMALRDTINSASSMTQTLTSDLADGQRKLLALAAGANQKAINTLVTQQNNGPLPGLHEMVEAPMDPKKELHRLISERKLGEAFTAALQRSDVLIVYWLCSQVDLQGILTAVPLPLSQRVLLSLLQQLSCDLANEMSQKLEWMRDVAIAINPVDPTIALHVRPIFEQVYQILRHQHSLTTSTPAEANSIRLVMHVINSVLMSCK